MSPWAYVLALSLAANALLGFSYAAKRDEVAVLTTQRDSARQDASNCSDATADLREQADKRAKESAKAIATARATALKHQTRAQELLAKSPTAPGDVCASSQAFIDDWLGGRTK